MKAVYIGIPVRDLGITTTQEGRATLSMQNLSILVISCDRYADVWPPFFAFFRKYWPDCPYPIYLGANRKTYVDSKVKMVLTGSDPNWAESARRMIEQIPTDYILMLLEDFLLLRPVDSRLVQRCLEALKAVDGGYLRLRPFPKPDHRVPGYPIIGDIEPGAPYRVALQAAIWRKDVLLDLLQDGETAWDMELKGSRRSDALDGFYSTWHPVLTYRAGVTMGKWVPFAVKICRHANVVIDLQARPIMTPAEDRKRAWRVWFTKIIGIVPWKRRRLLRNLLRKMHIMK